ncbi:hypothetical protein AB4Y43_01400 [Paraburkholderia sp. BR10872]|uniref:hypothetical protein n=1 Tax=Paraburkholderia sp. BR10872 TaxID=3236989 RepID=UPI0034D16127
MNLIIPVETETGMIYVHSTPISRDVFEANIFIISKTLSVLYEDGLTAFAGPRVAATMMKNIAIERGIWEGPNGVENVLMNEIRRLTNVVLPAERGWTTMLYEDAVRNEAIDADTVSEVEGQIVFFTCVSWMHKAKEVKGLLQGVNEIWESQNTLLNSTEWANSLPTSTPGESSGETATALSIPH